MTRRSRFDRLALFASTLFAPTLFAPTVLALARAVFVPTVLASTVLMCTTAAKAQKIIYVDARVANGGNGLLWKTVYNDLITALGTAGRGDEVWVARGRYPTRGKPFALADGVGLYGGFVGGETRKDQRVRPLFPTVLDGLGKNRVLQMGSSAPASTIVDGVTITGGLAKDGAGAYTYGGSPTFDSVVFLKNVAADSPTAPLPTAQGGGFYTYQGAPTLTDCVFQENVAQSKGGGLYTYRGGAELVRCRFVKNRCFDNVSTTNADVKGGGCYTYSGRVKLTACEFVENTVAYGTNPTSGGADGGGFYSYQAAFLLIDVAFRDNQAQSDGGGLGSYAGSRTIDGCTFSGNRAVDGAGLWLYTGAAFLFACEVRGNVASGSGGGLYSDSGTHFLISNLFAANRATSNGGAIHTARDSASPPGTLKLAACTLTANTAAKGGGLYVGSGAPIVVGSILWNNSSEISGAPGVTYSVVKGGYTGTGNSASDPRFRAPASGDYQLRAGSPAIDAGDNTAIPSGQLVDALCNPRLLDDPNTLDTGNGTGRIIDMGCFEYHNVERTAGTGEDLFLRSGVNAPPKRGTARLVADKDQIHVRVESPGGTFSGGILWILADAYSTGKPPVPIPTLPGLAVGVNTVAFPVGRLAPAGFTQSFVVPGNAPGISVLLQAGVLSSRAKNGLYGASNPVEFRF